MSMKRRANAAKRGARISATRAIAAIMRPIMSGAARGASVEPTQVQEQQHHHGESDSRYERLGRPDSPDTSAHQPGDDKQRDRRLHGRYRPRPSMRSASPGMRVDQRLRTTPTTLASR